MLDILFKSIMIKFIAKMFIIKDFNPDPLKSIRPLQINIMNLFYNLKKNPRKVEKAVKIKFHSVLSVIWSQVENISFLCRM